MKVDCPIVSQKMYGICYDKKNVTSDDHLHIGIVKQEIQDLT
jgi:hypothetical protein